ncbi:CLOCK-interacting pacemaker [Esox lucius]|nr:CLOCK-interacting pacemaker [Esox lucius]
MPKEHACMSRREPCESGKNAKDRSNTASNIASNIASNTPSNTASNTATLLVSMITADTESDGRAFCSSSEKDSGYSDNNSCTDWLHADGEDQCSSVSEARGSEGSQAQVRPEQTPPHRNQIPIPTLKPGGPDLTPIVIIKNIVLKQPLVVKNISDSQVDNPARKTKSRTYMPILRSYPRIAPHPSQKTPLNPQVKRTGSEDQNQSKRMCTEKDTVSSTTNSLIPTRQYAHKQPDPKRSLSQWQCPASPPSPRSRFPSGTSPVCVSSADTSTTISSRSGGSSSLNADRSSCRHVPGLSLSVSAHNRRFLNTLAILSHSGLLEITLRMRDLLHQNNATDRDIAQLRQHTELLCQASNNHNNPKNNQNDYSPYDNNNINDNNPIANTVWERLHQTMALSGCYPGLNNLRVEDNTHYCPEQGVGWNTSFKRDPVDPNIFSQNHKGMESLSPPSPILAPMSDLLPQEFPISHSQLAVHTSLYHSE